MSIIGLEIAAGVAGKIYDKFVGFVEAMGEIGELLDRAQESYATAMDRLSKGRENLVWQTERLKEMGAKTAKSISQNLLDSSEQSDEAAARNGESGRVRTQGLITQPKLS
jgi:DNA anti-recombination protein RmuC